MRWILVLSLALLIGCPPVLGDDDDNDSANDDDAVDDDDSNDDDDSSDDDDSVDGPALLLSAETLDFGSVLAGDSALRTLTLTNPGSETLLIADLALSPIGNFELAPPQATLVEPGDSQSWDVTYSPIRFESVEGSITIQSNDPAQPEATVALVGAGSAPSIDLDPPSFDFGSPELGCSADVEITISNVGDQPLTLGEVSYEDFSGTGELSATGLPAVGTVLDPGDSTSLEVVYVPTDVTPDSGVLHVPSDDPSTPDATAQQFGVASYPASVLDSFLQEGNNATDLLFVVHAGADMAEEQAALATNFASLMQIVDSLDMDYQMGVVTTDPAQTGALQGTEPFITPNSADPEGTFASNVDVGASSGSPRMGLHTAWLALTSPAVDPVVAAGDIASFSSTVRPVREAVAPAAPSSSAVPLPIPRLAPVTTATCPLRSAIESSAALFADEEPV